VPSHSATRPIEWAANVLKIRFFTRQTNKMYIAASAAIGESELILSGSGAIYHLGLRPEQLATTIITVGDPARVKEVSKYFDRVEHTSQHREFITHTGYTGRKRISVISTGIGTGNIDIVMNELDALANIDFKTRKIKEQKTTLSIIRLGTCGGLQPEIPVGSLVATTHAIGLDNLLHYYKYPTNPEEGYILDEFVRHSGLTGKPVMPYIAEGAIALRKHFTKGYLQGITATCPGFYAPQSRMLRLGAAYPNLMDALRSFKSRDMRILNFEMETAALYGLGKVSGHHCLSVSAIVANRALNKFSTDVEKDVDNMIQQALSVIEQI
jgi:uridine phosphorylase